MHFSNKSKSHFSNFSSYAFKGVKAQCYETVIVSCAVPLWTTIICDFATIKNELAFVVRG